jgi:hypothetical protein
VVGGGGVVIAVEYADDAFEANEEENRDVLSRASIHDLQSAQISVTRLRILVMTL